MSSKNKTGGGPGTNQFGIKGHAKIQASTPNVDLVNYPVLMDEACGKFPEAQVDQTEILERR